MSVDYKRILQAYLEHVITLEGTDFMYARKVKGLSDEERDALTEAANAMSAAHDATAAVFGMKRTMLGAQ